MTVGLDKAVWNPSLVAIRAESFFMVKGKFAKKCHLSHHLTKYHLSVK